ncbi:RluA family pseudouridine synthase [Shewanella sp. KT0246]|uniref:RluA family pseudouridine synthase n=1 Tax=Shewanella sp. KT0246 TaxID=2815912 RepID=UPI001BC73A88|nr:RluA family pseudouridine synthase [Shewanella sp. KT0246]GIU48191.1 RNA pseudouridine synthase [Shewanella sp. KT0246]
MSQFDPLFNQFNESIADISLPENFTFPFYYQPHPLAVIASEQLQLHLLQQTDWHHNFGLEDKTNPCQQAQLLKPIGKMFGVLVVKNLQGELGYLAAFSGKIAEQNILPHFVPPVFDMLSKDSFFKSEYEQINQLSHQLKKLESDPRLTEFEQDLNAVTQAAEQAIALHRQQMIENRKSRKAKRNNLAGLSEAEQKSISIEMSRQSVEDKHQLNALKRDWDAQIKQSKQQLDSIADQIDEVKQARKQLSNALQQKLFAQYNFLNIKGESRDLSDIFHDAPNHQPPAAAGECAAPKLLQYAFKNRLTPVVMAEFWWGESPKSEIKQHQNYYPACHGKCRPILGHMLDGMKVDENPLLTNPAEGVELPIIYQDDYIVIINKPAEFLSVPGKNITDSVFSRMKQKFPNATGPLIVHRLDMSTSGLMVIALSKEVNKHLVQQFINRTVTKRYIAKIDGELSTESGTISLPLRVDLDDRPKQLVCYEYGKHAETFWQKVAVKNGNTLVHLYPKTGRTHQLRVHSAHHDGLHMPILGDDLYGKTEKRLHLHAQLLSLHHPHTNQSMTFEVNADFE